MHPYSSGYLFLANLSSFVVVIPFLIGWVKKAFSRTGLNAIFFLMCTSLLVEIVCSILRYRHSNNLYVYRLYTLAEFGLLSLFFINTIPARRMELFIKCVIVVFLGIEAIDAFINGIQSMDNISTAAESIIMIFYSVCTFYFFLKNPVHAQILLLPAFWIGSAVLLYFSGSLLIFIFSNILEKTSEKIYYEFWGIHSVLNILFYSLISVGFWKIKAR